MSLDLTSIKESIASLEQAIEVYHACSRQPSHPKLVEVLQAGVIQNFEFTYELCWKFIKRWLEFNQGLSVVDGISRRELFRYAAEHQLITSSSEWFHYHHLRNKTSHTYHKETAKEVFEATLVFVNAAKLLQSNLEAKND